MILKSDAKFKEKVTCGIKYGMTNFLNFNLLNNSKVQKFHFDGPFLSKVYEVWAKKKQESSFMAQNSNAEFE